MIIIRENPRLIKCDSLTPSIKIGNSHHIIAMRNASDRAFEQVAIRMGRSWKQANERRQKRK